MLKVLVFPKDKNPYQELLYSQLRKKGVKIKYVFPNSRTQLRSLLFLLPLTFYYRARNYKIFHIHWTGSFATSFKKLKPIYTLYFLFMLFYLKFLGYGIIWTVHNVIPHEKQFTRELLIRKVLSKLAEAKIVHSNYTTKEMKEVGLDLKNTKVIPHGNYIGVYENIISKEKARKSFRLNKKDFVFLFFGLIREYKGIEDLLKEFKKLTKTNKKVKLIIAGYCSNDYLLNIINNYKKSLGKNLISHIKFIEGNETQYYFNAADVVALPFKKMTTSGSAILSTSFSKPIIAPSIGCLKEMPKDVGFFYDRTKKDALYNAMEKAIRNRKQLKGMGKNAFSYAKDLSWKKIANKTFEVYKSIL